MERIKTLHSFLPTSRLGASRVTRLFIIRRLLRQPDSKRQHAITANKNSPIILELSGITGMQDKDMATFNKSYYWRQVGEKVLEGCR